MSSTRKENEARTVTIAQLRHDALTAVTGWWSAFTGAGDPERDKIRGLQWAGGVRMHPQLLQSLFAYNDLARVIVSALPEWALRHGWTIKLRAADGSTALPASMQSEDLRMRTEAELLRLEAHGVQRQAAIWGQLYGGGLILVGLADGGSSADPLDLEALDAVEYLRDAERSDVQILEVDADPDSPRFGKPVTYEVRQHGGKSGIIAERWHHSRVIAYPGAVTPRELRLRNEGWDHSVLDHVVDKIKQTDGIWDNVSAMVADASQGVWKIKGLFQAVVSGKLDQIESRFSIADKTRSMFRSLLLDADQESFDYVHREFGGIDGILAQSAIRTAAAAQMPVTVLYGQSPAGMNATGESDIRLWYDRVEQYQTDVILPGLRRILFLVFSARQGPTRGEVPDGWRVEMLPVRKATPMEQGELAARQAQIDAANVVNGITTADEVAVSRYTAHGLSFETHIDVEPRRVRLLAARKAALEGNGEASPTPAPADPAPAPAAPSGPSE